MLIYCKCVLNKYVVLGYFEVNIGQKYMKVEVEVEVIVEVIVEVTVAASIKVISIINVANP